MTRNLQPAQGTTAILFVGAVSATALCFPDSLNMGVPHLTSFTHLSCLSVWFGIQFWITFVAGEVKFPFDSLPSIVKSLLLIFPPCIDLYSIKASPRALYHVVHEVVCESKLFSFDVQFSDTSHRVMERELWIL